MTLRFLLAFALSAIMLTQARADERAESPAQAAQAVEASAGRGRGPELAVQHFRLQHASAREANAILRSILDVRKTALDENTNTLVVSDAPGRLEQVARLLRTIDVERPLWRAELVARAGDGPARIVTLPLAGDAASWQAGGTPGSGLDLLRLDLKESSVNDDEVTLQMRFEVAAGHDTPAHLLRRELACTANLADGGSLELARAANLAAQRALATLLGMPAPVTAIELVVHRERSGAGGRKLGR